MVVRCLKCRSTGYKLSFFFQETTRQYPNQKEDEQLQNLTHITPDFAISPQITAAQLAELKAAGFTTVICNRPDNEDAGQPTFAEIEAAAKAAGLEARHIPIKPGQATETDIDDFHAAITTAKGKVLAYCRTGGRAQSLFAAKHR